MYTNSVGNSFYSQLVSDGKITEKVGRLLDALPSKNSPQSTQDGRMGEDFAGVYDNALLNRDTSVGGKNPSAMGGNFQMGSTNYDDIFQLAANTYHVPVSLLKAVAKAESNVTPNAVSSSGAQGIMQLMPTTAAALGVVDPMDPKQNIMGGANYLSQKLEEFNGDISLALAAYNSGSGAVAKYGGIPPFKETQQYVEKVLGYMQEGVADSVTPSFAQQSIGSSSNSSLNRGLSTNDSSLKDAILLKMMNQQQASMSKLGDLNLDDKDGFSF